MSVAAGERMHQTSENTVVRNGGAIKLSFLLQVCVRRKV